MFVTCTEYREDEASQQSTSKMRSMDATSGIAGRRCLANARDDGLSHVGASLLDYQV
jgi:hypothetical protein